MLACAGVSMSGLVLLAGSLVLAAATHVADAVEAIPPYIHQCSRRDPKLYDCYVEAIMHIRPWLAQGIPEVAVPSTEPFRLDELSLSLTGGPGGYRISLRDIDVSGISNYTVRELSVGEAGAFALDVSIPEMALLADYSSSGVLIMIRATGRGALHGVLQGVRCVLRGAVSVRKDERGVDFMHLDRLVVDIKVQGTNLRIEKAPGENAIIAAATNMLLKTSGQLVLDAMIPELRVKLVDVFMGIANSIFDKVPLGLLLRD